MTDLVVSDASPINYLVLIEAVEILPRLFGRVVVPRFVWEKELQHPDAPEAVRRWARVPATWIKVMDAGEASEVGLDPGEAHAIALAVELQCPILLDEREAREVARAKGLKILGTVGVLEEGAARGLLDLTNALERLRSTNARIHQAIVREALERDRKRRGS